MRRIRVATFNILHGRRAGAGGAVDLDLLGHSAASLRADVLALQEVDVGVPRSGRADQAAAVGRATGLRATFAKATRVGGIGKYGNALLVDGRTEDVEVLGLPRTVRSHEARVALLATVRLDGAGPFTMAATHLSIHRPEVHAQLQAVVAALVARPGPHVLVGDLNLGSDEVATVVEAAGLRLAPADAPTFPNPDPTARIDHVAVSPDLQIAGVEVVATASSDHCALIVDLEVP
ncbi:MAG: endonuclease/exonuclease/phosphatase family protein [Actinomycetota bacterium]|nr:endonuclease/exonuclease/phosphatase family protein [Actinomycetota bacterium]